MGFRNERRKRKPSNYPPGVTGNEPQINGDARREAVHQQIDDDATREGLSDMDVECAWYLGLGRSGRTSKEIEHE